MGWARAELGLCVLSGAGLAVIAYASDGAGILRSAINALPWVLLWALLAWRSWRRLRRSQAQYAEFGPDASAPPDFWTSPRYGGLIGVTVLAIALVAALAPALLLRP